MAFSLPATLVSTTSVLFAISASAVVLSTFLPSAVFSSTPVSSMNAPRVPEPSSREMTVIAPEAPLSTPSAACVPEAELPQEAAKPAEPVEGLPEDLTVMDEATGVEDTVPAMESETDAQPVAPRLVVAPLVGEEVAAFSVDELTYNETLGDWRTHDGIDIAAEVGTQVIAACSGVVTAVRDDDMMGTLVTIAHDDGYETTYANLRSSPGVGEGQYVSAGEVIGAVGSSSIAEFSMPAHLHFSVSKDGVPCDPAEFLN